MSIDLLASHVIIKIPQQPGKEVLWLSLPGDIARDGDRIRTQACVTGTWEKLLWEGL